ncbi:type II toxin-antitoxin system RelE/ParE family toxin [Corynebacterium coyleae]|uniref:Plasmid maintenance system killer protein n=1 Tax=Corynebacterium coyleae TaxID=53374 RepID=A0AAP6XNV3_9CORY|nr:type II toxin-antitoxin system RelE/ParE family toxin [Corynebacterium coyleae]NJJ04432.1 plasmid maintenance system killer protein [Corynebacterium coyleae]PLA37140.1 plasmid maintenance system killer protein [Corynebacterium coyleae]
MVRVRIRFEDKILKRLAEDSSFQPKRWSSELVRAYRRKIQVLANASDERDLRALKSLRLEQLRGNRVGTSSIRLNKQFRLVIRFETDEDRRIVVVIEMVDYH